MGADINVYLYASKEFGNSNKLYVDNPYNLYLYSPFFALLLKVISWIKFEIARSIWAIINVTFVFRIYFILYNYVLLITKPDQFSIKLWLFLSVLLGLGFINHNLILGQITIIIIWLSIEGLHQIFIRKNETIGAFLLALGINIKILPAIFLIFLFFNKKIRSCLVVVFFSMAFLILPGFFIGFENNYFLHIDWFDSINPTKNKYFFENDNACNSLNCFLPAFFYDFGAAEEIQNGFERKIFLMSFENLNLMLQFIRILLISILFYSIYWNFKNKSIKIEKYIFWSLSIIFLVILLIFPHQLKYSNLFILPAGSYLIMTFIDLLKNYPKISFLDYVLIIFISILLFIQAIMGRDFIGAFCVNILDYTHYLGVSNLLVCFSLVYFKPKESYI